MKIITMLNSKPAIEELAQQPIPIDIGFKLALLIKEMNVALNLFDKQKLDILKEYGTYNSELNKFDFIEAEDGVKASTELQSLIEQEVSITIPEISMQDLIDCEIKVKPSSLIVLDWLIKQ